MQTGIGEKLGMLWFFTGTFLFSMINAFIYGWELTLVLLTMMPLMAVAAAIMSQAQSGFADEEMTAYGKAGAIAEEVLAGIRTVVAFGGQQKEVER